MKHFKQLDGLRFIAVFLVLVEHFATIIGRHISAGYYGVDLFFVISGFLITNILVKSNEPFGKAYKKFIGRRTLRIFPIYYLTILVLLLIGNKDIHQYLTYCLTYTYNYAWSHFNIPINPISHFWSLCVEEQFYLFWPFIILGLRNKISLMKFSILLLIVVCGIQQQFHVVKTTTIFINGLGLIPQAYALGIGALGAVLYKENKVLLKLLENRTYEYASIVALIFFISTNFGIKYLICPIISLFFVFKTTHKGFAIPILNNFLSNKTIVYIGSISYGIYLYHLPLGHYITEYVFDPIWGGEQITGVINWTSLGKFAKIQWHSWIIKLPLYSFLSIGLAHISYKYFEKPLLTLKDKWFRYERI